MLRVLPYLLYFMLCLLYFMEDQICGRSKSSASGEGEGALLHRVETGGRLSQVDHDILHLGVVLPG